MFLKQYFLRAVFIYLKWISAFIHFHDKRHPLSMGDNEVERCLAHFALKVNVSPQTQATAFNSLSFLYKHITNKPLF
ncbi:phage integrase N-terminal SAM-like domain-containing protein [Salinimonas sediminis]|uniref:phage integrase N-terminal SAM-like domain-containing protein n=1 Tax=Salinimonas sediminis TaxID=2303538 RepID=UPI001E3F0C70|nr:phage integrase N-terminal SAM-like domain-containing protein [Salinimonas sediminis]